MTTKINKKFYTAKNDRVFKEVMLNNKNKDILKRLLETILKVEVKDIEVNNIERNTRNVQVRRKYLDILLTTDKGRVDIELNASNKKYLHARNFAFISEIYASYTQVGEEYTEDLQILQINLTYGIRKDRELIRTYKIQDGSKKCFVDNFKIIEVNMDRIMEFWYDKKEEEIEKYKYLIMLDLDKEELESLSKRDRMVERFKMYIEVLNSDPKFGGYISEEEDKRKIRNTEIKLATEKGIKQNAIKTAKNLMEMSNLTIEQIANATGLSVEELKKMS